MTHRWIYTPHDSFPMGFTTEMPIEYNDMKRLVGGLIEATYPSMNDNRHPHLTWWCNEEGRMMTPFMNILATKINWPVYQYDMVGDGFFGSGNDEGESVGLSDDEIMWLRSVVEDDFDELTFDMTLQEVLQVRDIRREVRA